MISGRNRRIFAPRIFGFMKPTKCLVGPEVIWIIAFLLAGLLRKINTQQGGKYNAMIEQSTSLPVILLGLTMLLFFIPPSGRPYLMLRIALTAIIGTHFLMTPLLQAHTVGGPGVGTIYLVAYILIFLAVPV